MAYKYHKEPHELHSNNARLRAPTEEEKKIIEERTKTVRANFKKAFPKIDIEKHTFKPTKK